MKKIINTQYMKLIHADKHFIHKLLILFFIVFFVSSLYQYLQMEKETFFVDLRNRVTGMRLMNKGIDPYFFKWNNSYPETLYDPADKDIIKNNMTTSPPSILWLMQPLNHLSYSQICVFWMILHYFFFILIFTPLYLSEKTTYSRNLIVLGSIILLISDQWIDSLFRGQSHFIFPAVISLILMFSSQQTPKKYLYIGLLLSFLVWTRPNALIIIPFLFLCIQTDKRGLLTGLCTGFVFFAGLTIFYNQEHYWVSFYNSCKEWVINNTVYGRLPSGNKIPVIEGKLVLNPHHPLGDKMRSEIGNIFHLLKFKFNYILNPLYTTIVFGIIYISAFLLRYKIPAPKFHQAVFTGVLLYWIAEILSPVLKMNYYYVELFPVCLFLIANYTLLTFAQKILTGISILFMFLDFIPMNLVLSELVLITAIISYLWKSGKDTIRANSHFLIKLQHKYENN